MKSSNSTYILFVDESGESHLNHSGQHFILSTVMVNRNDFSIIEGYLRLLKRQFLGKDLINLHATDLAERTYLKYRKLIKPKNQTRLFYDRMIATLKTVPFYTGIYRIDKNQLRTTLNYVPKAQKKLIGIDMNLPYQKATIQALLDFAQFLEHKNALGEVVVESRFGRDGDFVSYFDLVRKKTLPGSVINPSYKIVQKRINSITISNKKVIDGGLELADLLSYSVYRHYEKDPHNKIKVPISCIQGIFNTIKQKSYLKDSSNKMTTVKKL